MNVYLENDRAVKHTHHFAAFNCIMEDMSPIEELIGKPALNCEDMRVITEFKPNCQDMLFGWGSGGEVSMILISYSAFVLSHLKGKGQNSK